MENETNLSVIPENNELSAKTLRKASNLCSLMLLIFVAIMYSVDLLPPFIIPKSISRDSQLYRDITKIVEFSLQYLIGVPLAIFIYKRTKLGKASEKTGSLLRKPEQSLWWVIKWIIIVIGATYIANLGTTILYRLFNSLTGIELHQITIEAENSFLSKLGNVLAAVILAPIFEEMLMRDAYLGNIKRFGSWSAIIMTGLFFGLLHANYPQIPFAAVMGMGSAFLVIKTKSIIPSLIVHFSINTIGGILSIVLAGFDLEALQNGDMQPLYDNLGVLAIVLLSSMLVLLIVGIAIVLIILEIIMHKDSFKLQPVEPGISEKKKLGILLTAPLTLVLTGLLLTITVINAIP